MSIKQKFKQWLYTNYPSSKSKVEAFFANKPLLRRILNVGFSPTFRGWGMTTVANLPWSQPAAFSGFEADYSDCNKFLNNLISSKSFTLSQFSAENDISSVLEGLMWRHYIVYWSASFAAKNTKIRSKNLVECGVCDGLTAYFAMTALSNSGSEWQAYLYDAWGGMREDLLLQNEMDNKGVYSYLDVETTKANLSLFGDKVKFNQGYIPESFSSADNPEEVVWMHIDLNSAVPTIAALEYFWDKLAAGGVVLFDDYGWPGYEDTRDMILEWFNGKDGSILPLPTGQAIIFKG